MRIDKTIKAVNRETIMMISKDTKFSAVKAFVHWWLLGVAGLLPATWVAEAMPTRELQAVCYGVGIVWFVLAAWIIGRRGDRYTKRVVRMPAGEMVAAATGWAVHPYFTDPTVVDNDDFGVLYD